MEPVISPWVIYWVSVLDSLGGALSFVVFYQQLALL